MAKLYNLARMTTATAGTGTITLGAAVSGYLTFALAGVANGDVVDYAIKDGSNSEIGIGTYTTAGTTLTRTVTKSTNANAAINLSGTAEVFISPRAETLITAVKQQIFTASGTYTPSPGMIYCVAECVGPGGGGGACVGAAASIRTGAGGSAGGYSRAILSAATIGASKAVVVGTKGTGGAAGANNGTDGSGATTLGATLCVANAGKGGLYSNGAQIPHAPSVAAAGTGDLAIAGNPGDGGVFLASGNFIYGGRGGAGPFGGGPRHTTLNASAATAGDTGTGYGSGGSGACSFNVVANAAGGNAVDGVVFITEFCSVP